MSCIKTILAAATMLAAVSLPAQLDTGRGLSLNLKPEPEVSIGTNDIRRDAVVLATERAMPSVVNIATETVINVRDPWEMLFQEYWSPYHQQQRVRSQYNLGSGVIIDEEGYLITNDHVVRRADKIQIQLATSREVYEAKLVASDPKNDIALLKIIAPPGTKFSAVKLAAENDLLLGETVLALGNPFGLGGSVSRGILSSKNRMTPIEGQQLKIENWLQTDAAINPGNSGGPLVNLHGELIGINVAVLDQLGGRIARGIGFAVPVQQVTEALANAFTPEAARSLWFGARIKASGGPLTVTSVQLGSPAALAGLKVGDTITRVNGKTPRSFLGFNEIIAGAPQTNTTLAVVRNGETKNFNVRLIPEKDFFNSELIQRKLGVTLQEITPQLAQNLLLPVTEGFIVTAVDPKSEAASQLAAGVVVTGIDDQRPDNLVAFAKILHERSQGEKTRLGVIVKRQTQQGPFVQTTISDAAVELTLR